MKLIRAFLSMTVFLLGLAGFVALSSAQPPVAPSGFVAVISIDTMILPGTGMHLKESIDQAAADGAKALVVELNTPGGMLQTSQEMIQEIFASPIPVIVYVTPTGSMATSAGVFIAQAAHVAAMAPGTTIGAAHPVDQDGKNIDSDMRAKVESTTVAMVKAIADRRGRNTEWAEQSVKESSSLTAAEALPKKVIDYIAPDLPALLRQAAGKKIDIAGSPALLEDLSTLPVKRYDFSLRNELVNTLAHPNVIALLWLLATTGLSIELYNPGLILPGVVGGISLVLALAMSQVIPMNQGAIILLVLGAILIGIEMFTGSLMLGISGLISMVIGTLYLVDTEAAPGMGVSPALVLPAAGICGGFLMMMALTVYKAYRKPNHIGKAELLGKEGRALETFSDKGMISIQGEIWKARPAHGVITKDDPVRVSKILDGLTLEVEILER